MDHILRLYAIHTSIVVCDKETWQAIRMAPKYGLTHMQEDGLACPPLNMFLLLGSLA